MKQWVTESDVYVLCSLSQPSAHQHREMISGEGSTIMALPASRTPSGEETGEILPAIAGDQDMICSLGKA